MGFADLATSACTAYLDCYGGDDRKAVKVHSYADDDDFFDDDLYAASAARAAVAKAVHAYGKAHAGRLREAFELVGALWLHDAAATHVERPTVASASVPPAL